MARGITSKKKDGASIEVMTLATTTLEARIVGTSPMICNSMNAKVMQQLLLPPKKKNKSERENNLKHNPISEYRSSPYRAKGDDAPTRIVFPAGAIKKAIASAALDIPGAVKAQIGRLSYIERRDVPIYGVPQMLMSPVRNSDPGRTPDVRTRAILPEWAATVEITFVRPNLTEQAIANLLAAAGIIIGLGDWRQQKGSGSFGQFRLAEDNDPEFQRIVATGGREAQDAALENPTCYDLDSEELFAWFQVEAARREMKAV